MGRRRSGAVGALGGAGPIKASECATTKSKLSAPCRLAPEHPCAAALADVLAAYRVLLFLGFPANRIMLVGHGVGATLALSALSRLRAPGEAMSVGAMRLDYDHHPHRGKIAFELLS
jgi:hypothetical protein